jgi:hypothetical protein
MKKIFAILLLSVISLPFVAAQESVFLKGDKVVNAGIGFGSIVYNLAGWKTAVPPISASFEMGIVDGILEKATVGVGGYIGYSSYKLYDSWQESNIIVAARGSFHYPLVDKLDTYAGVIVGYNISNGKELIAGYNYNSSGSSAVFSPFVGGRYYFTEKIAGMAELGRAISWINVGLAFKL